MLKRLIRRKRSAQPERPIDRAGSYGKDSPELDALVDELVAGIDPTGFQALRDRHEKEMAPHPGPRKYLDLPTWIRRHLIHARALGLTDGPPRNILDLGCGAAYFPYLCQHLGHTARAVDLDNYPPYNDLVELLGVDRRAHRVEFDRPLPEFGLRFDWVTAFNIMFNRNNYPEMWTPQEWRQFLRHLGQDHLAEGGQVFLKLNPIRIEGYDSDALFDFFRSLGGDVEFPFVHLRSRESLAAL